MIQNRDVAPAGAAAHARCRAACEAFTRIVDDKPEITHQTLAAAVRHIIQLRDALIVERRTTPSRQADEDLLRVNSVLSLASGAEFPLVGIRWERIIALRNALREMFEAGEACGGLRDFGSAPKNSKG